MGIGAHLRFGYQGAAPVGRLFGSTKVVGAPDTTVSRVVHLVYAVPMIRGMLSFDATPVRWVLSDANGNWSFEGLDHERKYHAIAYDHTGQYDPVVKMNLVPTVD